MVLPGSPRRTLQRRLASAVPLAVALAVVIGGCLGGSGACPEGLTACSDEICADLKADPLNCGKCGNKCGRGFTCEETGCSCNTAFYTICQGVNGEECVDLDRDRDNCGQCGNKCPEGQECFVQCRP